MRKFRRLNRKGFTLIELLAVIVILAIVMGISATSVLNSINNSRKSSLLSAAQTYASNINTWAAEDALIQTDSSRKLGDTFETLVKVTNKNNWVCLNAVGNIQNGGSSTTLLNALGISTSDVTTGAAKDYDASTTTTAIAAKDVPTDKSCSAIRYNTSAGAYEILLVAKKGGKYYVTADTDHYAFSRATTYYTNISD